VEQIALSFEPVRRLFTVSEFTELLRRTLDREFADLWIAGELSGCKQAPSGHYYFTLKDEEAQLKCVCFRSAARYLRFKPQDGVSVLARGRIDVYAGRGEYQLVVEALEPRGYGALQLAFEQLKKKLALEGLFEPARKRRLPPYPTRIGIVTSPSGAVIQDMLNVLSRRFPGLHIRIYPALVQGEGSVEQVCRGVEYFSRSGWAQVVIVARGGGSLEDLWTFNEEAVARAIAACKAPVISAVGHETDFTIADFVADLRAPTPSAAAELVICTRDQLLDQIAGYEKKLEQWARYRITLAARRLHQQGVDRAASLLHRAINRRAQRVDELEQRLRDRLRAIHGLQRRRLAELTERLRRQDVRLRLAGIRRRLDRAENALAECMRMRLLSARNRFMPLAAHLSQLSPLKILRRGYAIVQNKDGAIVKDPAAAPVGSAVRIRLAYGRLGAEVTESTPDDSSAPLS
jgi:exodeoxyribonuclease VII large subunit